MLTVGAAPWHTPTALEPFSSRGPTPDFRVKPDLVGADRGETVTRGAAGYAGTSQAAAHVSGLAALAKGTLPTASPARLAAYLKNFARPRGPVPNVEWGYGFAALPGGVEPLTPSEPRKLTATVQNQTVTLTWQPPLVGAPAGYSLEVGSGPGLANLATLALGNTLTYTTPAPNGTYYVRLRARSASGLGPASSEQVVVVGPSPGPPAGLQAIVDGANVKLTWSAAATGGPPTGYVLVASPTRGGAPLARFTVTTPALSAVNVPAGTYYVRVHATNAAGMSAPSTELVVVVAPGSR
jgi:hypothetical protein